MESGLNLIRSMILVYFSESLAFHFTIECPKHSIHCLFTLNKNGMMVRMTSLVISAVMTHYMWT